MIDLRIALIDAQPNYCDEAIAWHDAAHPGAFDRTDGRTAFVVGHAEGWRNALSYLKLHGHIDLEGRGHE